MVHQPSDKRIGRKHSGGAAKSNRRPNLSDASSDVPATRLPGSEPIWVKQEDGKILIDETRIEYEFLIGKPYIPGRQDCGSLIRDAFSHNTGKLFTDHARPDGWWEHGMNLFTEIYREEGFRPVDITVRELRVFDVMLMSYGCRFPNHSGLYIGNGMILQHLHGRLSSKDNIRSHNRDALLAIVRHPDIIIKPKPEQTLNLVDMLSPYWKAKLAERLGDLDDGKIKDEIKRIGEEHLAKAAAGAPQP